jgi:hypothetical protein
MVKRLLLDALEISDDALFRCHLLAHTLFAL